MKLEGSRYLIFWSTLGHWFVPSFAEDRGKDDDKTNLVSHCSTSTIRSFIKNDTGVGCTGTTEQRTDSPGCGPGVSVEHVHRPFEFETEIHCFDWEEHDPMAVHPLIFTTQRSLTSTSIGERNENCFRRWRTYGPISKSTKIDAPACPQKIWRANEG
jgi:hypothetical protein